MAVSRDLEYINNIRANAVLEDGSRSFLSEWEPVRYLGQGSYGVVYEIRRGNERCAVKIIDMSRPNIDYSVEISALEMLRGQKHAAHIYEHAYVMINNGSFMQRYLLIRMNLLSDLPESMGEDEVAAMAEQVCEVLSQCHGGETKLYHCDIKPENILKAGDGSYILCDFGASNITQKSHKSSGHAGTPLYEAPEMLRFEAFDGRSDLFSLGITMYSLLNNGLPPFAKNNNDAEAVRLRLEGKRAIPAIDGVSADLMKIIRKACAFDADKRYRSADEMRKALLAVIQEREVKRQAEEARIKAEEERKRAEQQRDDGVSENNPYAKTSAPGENKAPAPVRKTKRKPFGIIATAVALVAAIVTGVIFIPGIGVKKDSDTAAGDNAVSTVSGSAAPTTGITGLSADTAVGDHVYFGSYPQTADGEVQPIEWRVLDIQDGAALMISEYLLYCKKYDPSGSKWDGSTLRYWLNNGFMEDAFSESEQERILLRDNSDTNTEDKVFCLSVEEANRYFTDNKDRMAAPTEYAIKYGAWTSDSYTLENGMKTGWWWLRSPGSSSGFADYVDGNGGIYNSVGNVSSDSSCVRPVVFASLSAES